MGCPPLSSTAAWHAASGPSEMMGAMTPPDGWTQTLITHLGIELWRIPVVVLSAVGIYLAFLVLVRVFGVRVLAGWNGFDAVVLIMLGSVAGRVIIGHPPTLAAGVIGLASLLALEAAFGAFQQATGRHGLNAKPRVIMVHGRFVESAMRRAHLTPVEVYGVLRRSGISDPSQVQCVILESTGGLSVIRKGQQLAPEMLDGVIGADLVLNPKD